MRNKVYIIKYCGKANLHVVACGAKKPLFMLASATKIVSFMGFEMFWNECTKGSQISKWSFSSLKAAIYGFGDKLFLAIIVLIGVRVKLNYQKKEQLLNSAQLNDFTLTPIKCHFGWSGMTSTL